MPNSTSTSKSPSNSARKANTPRISIHEQTYGAFYDRTIAAADSELYMAAPLMRELNTVRTVVAGLGQVMRIVTGNCVLEDEHDPEDPESQPPLSRFAEGQLTAMVGAVCELLCGSIDARASLYNDKAEVQS